MKEHPILFSAQMIRAILNGTKTQTRRIIKLPSGFVPTDRSFSYLSVDGGFVIDAGHRNSVQFIDGLRCPYGSGSDCLWVKETWKPHADVDSEGAITEEHPIGTCVKYRADGAMIKPDWKHDYEGEWCECHEEETKWRPSIFMPRWASRLTLEVVKVRVERLNDISDEDAKSEGLYPNPKYSPARLWTWDGIGGNCTNPVYAYQLLWESINGPGSWAANPWVWVVEFRRVAK